MKKSLLLIAALALGFVGAKAEDVSFEVTNIDPALVNADEYVETTYKGDGTVDAYAHWNGLHWVGNDQFKFTFSYDAETIGTKPCLYTAKEGKKWSIRIYTGAEMTFTSTTPFKQLTFVIADSKKGVPTVNTGSCILSGSNVVWSTEGDAVTSVSFTFSSKDQMRFSEAIISTEGGDPEPIEKTSVTALSQLTSLANNEEFKMDCDLTVAYANGSYNYVFDGANYGLIYKSGLGLIAGKVVKKGWEGKISIYNNLIEMVPDAAVTAEDGGTMPAPMEVLGVDAETTLIAANQNVYVKLIDVEFAEATPASDAGKTEEGVDLRSYTGKFGDTEVAFYQRFGVPSVPAGKYNVIGFISVFKEQIQVLPIAFEGEAIEKTSVTALSQLSKMENNEEFKMDCDLTLVYAKGSYNYVYDGANYGLIYKSGFGIEAGKVLKSGWEGKISIYNNLIEMIPDAEVTAEDGGTVPAPYEVQDDEAETALTAANQNVYVKLLGVEFADATPAEDAGKTEEGTDLRSFTGKFGDTEVAFYQRFGVPSVPAGKYNVIGFISVFKEQIQVLPTAYEEVAGIEGVDVDNTPAHYYDIQGIEVANPRQGGLYIRVQGGVASKVKF